MYNSLLQNLNMPTVVTAYPGPRLVTRNKLLYLYSVHWHLNIFQQCIKQNFFLKWFEISFSKKMKYNIFVPLPILHFSDIVKT